MPPRGRGEHELSNAKLAALDPFRDSPRSGPLTTDQGLPIAHTDDSLKAGVRGPSLLEDFHHREKITRFDHERIPERVVHARGSGAHGHFELYEPIPELSRAALFNDTSTKTPVFVRFSTVQGSRGSADCVRDVRGFAVKFYTPEGNFDLVGNNMPVFFVQDGIKFPDFVHAVKPEPANEIPQGASAHDSFWDFVSLVPESAHMVMWVMSDRGLPRSYRMMEGFGVHTFRLINAAGEAKLVKFHWKPVLGAHSLVWDEAQQINGKDPDFHRRDLWNAIECGAYPEYELGIQVMNEGDELKYGFDLLDATKLVPEELVPVRRIGKLTLDRNPQNFFAETEQVAFCISNLVPGIEVSDDPLLQSRLFSYLDTQLTRLGGPNFAEIPINKPIAAVANHQQDGFHRDTINTNTANYHPNSLGGGCPFLAGDAGFVHRREKVHGELSRIRSESFRDHFSQATLFVASQSAAERRHLTNALRFELSKVTRVAIRARYLRILREIDLELAEAVAQALGLAVPSEAVEVPPGTSAPGPRGDNGGITISAALSLANQPPAVRSRKVALLVADGFAAASTRELLEGLVGQDIVVEVIAPTLGQVLAGDGPSLAVDKTLQTTASVLYDAVVIADGTGVEALLGDRDAVRFVEDQYQHCKPIAAIGEGRRLCEAARVRPDAGVLLEGDIATGLAAALARHRIFARENALAGSKPGQPPIANV